jgi:hypothetical protein
MSIAHENIKKTNWQSYVKHATNLETKIFGENSYVASSWTEWWPVYKTVTHLQVIQMSVIGDEFSDDLTQELCSNV